MPKSYNTTQGQAWDQIAAELWGREDHLHHLLAANPKHRHLQILPADLKLNVPDISIPAEEEPPPWQKR
ncbi:tail protein X [Dethiosulfatarculus sandiegensis]|uniref:Tail protein n=1 Tax=Dethiosulfatarculus sandiegensis TaxID=1429043 RepID=A0A0D2JA12_9BACT|nr:tail protein X [Dethiosulfatarculus sandiegensis]KIX14984.1 tail protein [Dethiosulfatarculus sandiegensis]